jgi:hypothetical protein
VQGGRACRVLLCVFLACQNSTAPHTAVVMQHNTIHICPAPLPSPPAPRRRPAAPGSWPMHPPTHPQQPPAHTHVFRTIQCSPPPPPHTHTTPPSLAPPSSPCSPSPAPRRRPAVLPGPGVHCRWRSPPPPQGNRPGRRPHQSRGAQTAAARGRDWPAGGPGLQQAGGGAGVGVGSGMPGVRAARGWVFAC